MLSNTVGGVGGIRSAVWYQMLHLIHLTLLLLSRKSLTPFVSNVKRRLWELCAEHHQGTGSEKFSAKVAGARIKFQADTWCTSWPPAARSARPRGRVASPPPPSQVVEPGQEAGTEERGGLQHHVWPAGRRGRPQNNNYQAARLGTDGRSALFLFWFEKRKLWLFCASQLSSALFRMTQGITSRDWDVLNNNQEPTQPSLYLISSDSRAGQGQTPIAGQYRKE